MRSLRKTCVVKVSPDKPDSRAISRAAAIIRSGGLVGFPTETVYGIAADPLNKRTMARLYAAKERPRGKPFTVHISDLATIEEMGCGITKEARALIGKFWPGPLTIILKTRTGKKIGFRMPDNCVALELLKKVGVPVVAPSANLSGEEPPRTARDVLRYMDGKLDMLIDAGPASVGIESTVVDLTRGRPKILREGAIKERSIIKAVRSNG